MGSSGAVIIVGTRKERSFFVSVLRNVMLMIMIMHAYGLYRSQIFYLQTKIMGDSSSSSIKHSKFLEVD
ncbi:hypothetical protein PRUPE_8G262400 [Prunus persica]|uniref:Uncharacterized protein n=1 Tax=Prunus persica TaxID=3760 RepID=A0A251N3M1_PRUPE|nr:hypothetical protein PRUPE_8G262400 [Prunus persica]